MLPYTIMRQQLIILLTHVEKNKVLLFNGQ